MTRPKPDAEARSKGVVMSAMHSISSRVTTAVNFLSTVFAPGDAHASPSGRLAATKHLRAEFARIAFVIGITTCALGLSAHTGQIPAPGATERRAEPYTAPYVDAAAEEPIPRNPSNLKPLVEIAPPNEAELMRVRAHNRDRRPTVIGIPVRLARPISIDIPATTVVAGQREWQGGVLASPNPGTVIWTGAVHSPGSSALSLTLAGLRAQPRVSWLVYGATGRVHEFSPRSEMIDSPSVQGDTIWLEVEMPMDSSIAISFQITGVSYIRDDLVDEPDGQIDFDFPFINAVCASTGETPAHGALKNLQKAVGRIFITFNGQSNGGCTGTLITNTRDPGAPYFITAEHCVKGMRPGDNAAIKVYWDYLNASCTDSTLAWDRTLMDVELPQSNGGDLLVSASADENSDFALFRLHELPPPNKPRHFVGWSTFPFSSEFYRLSHPGGRPQMFTRHEWRRQDWRENCEWWELLLGSCREQCPKGGYDRYYYSSVKEGTHKGGSSGSAAINISADGRNYFVGQLLGSCPNGEPRTMDGALNYYFDRVAAWLDPPAECQDITLEVYANGSPGTVRKVTQPNCGSIYRAGTRVWIKATPAPGYEFDHWDEGVIENPSAAETYATIRSDITPVYRAYFRPATPPANDRCGFATLVTKSPFTETVGTTGATTDDAHDPVPSCNSSRRKNVWYRFTADAATAITIDTSGSTYQTVIAVYRGSDCFALGAVACSAQPLLMTSNSGLQFVPVAGESYKVQISGVNPPTISYLAVRIDGPIANKPPSVTDGLADARSGPTTEPFPAADPEGGPLTFRITSAPSQGTVTIDQQFGEFTYTPNIGAANDDEFQYVANDGTHDSPATGTIRILLPASLTLSVTSTTDAPDAQPGNGICFASGHGCTLRAAIMELNAHSGRPGVINVPAGLYTLTGASGEDMAHTGDLDIRVPTIVAGAGPSVTIIQSNTTDRVFDVPVNTQVTLRGLTVQKGQVSGRGGGIRSVGLLRIEHVVVTDNSASGEGGGISSTGALRLTNSSLIRNTADGGEHSGFGAGALRVAGTAVVLNSTLALNFSDGPGGAIRNYGRLFVGYSTIIDNTTRAGATAVDTWSLDDPALLVKSNIISGSCLVTSGEVISAGYNIVSTSACASTATDRTVTDFGLAPLSVQSGGTIGALPLSTSPAVDTIPDFRCLDWTENELLADQRTSVRPRDGNGDDLLSCDAGALEREDSRSDLTTTRIDPPPPSVVLKKKFTVTDSVHNQGGSAAGATTTRYYLSPDSVRSIGDKLLTGNNRAVPALEAGGTSTGSVNVLVPTSTKVGIYYLLACADDLNAEEEIDESNNCLVSSTTVEVRAPDLVETAITNPPGTASPGSSFSVTDTVANQGDAPTEKGSTTRYYLSLDTKKQAKDPLLAGTRIVPALDAGANSAGLATVTIPLGTPQGSFHLLACVDDLQQSAESNETNNCKPSATKVVVQP
jgi:CSLREA domain-containing protein